MLEKNKRQLRKGIKAEREHASTIRKIKNGKLTVNQAIRQIAKDHIKEIPDYYDRLEKVEKGLTGNKEYKYRLMLRPFDGYPKENFIRWEHDNTTYGVMVFSEPLNNWKALDLIPVTELHDAIDGKVYSNQYFSRIIPVLTNNEQWVKLTQYVYDPKDEPNQEVYKFDLSFSDFLTNVEQGFYTLVKETQPQKQPSPLDLEMEQLRFVGELATRYAGGEKLTKRNIKPIAEAEFTRVPGDRRIRELTEVAQIRLARHIIAANRPSYNKTIQRLRELYEKMPVFDYRDSTTSVMQQFSTPIYIGYMMGAYCAWGKDLNKIKAFEPSAGNGLLLSYFAPDQVTVNELDSDRHDMLKFQGYKNVLKRDCSIPFPENMHKTFDCVLTNPPFYSNSDDKTPCIYGGLRISSFDQRCALRALDCMKDDGRAALLLDGSAGSTYYPHAYFDDNGDFKGENKNFFNYLYANYIVEDIISINGHKLYSRQGQATNLRLVLIAGRRYNSNAWPPKYNPEVDKLVNTTEELWSRIQNPERPARIVKLDDDAALMGKIRSAFNAGKTELFQQYKNELESRHGYKVIVKGKKMSIEKIYQEKSMFSKIIKCEIEYLYNL